MGTQFFGNNLTATGEVYEFSVYRRLENSDYEWESTPSITFYGKPANSVEKRNYRLMQGVNTSNDSVFIMATNLPTTLQIRDKVQFLGKTWTIESIGYYFDANRLVNARIMSNEYIMARSPKGITLN